MLFIVFSYLFINFLVLFYHNAVCILVTGPQNIQPINYLELYEPPAPSQDALLQTKTSSEEEEHEAKTKKEGLEKLVTISIV